MGYLLLVLDRISKIFACLVLEQIIWCFAGFVSDM